MKILKSIVTNTCYTFSVLSLLIGILCKVGVLGNLPYSDTIFPLAIMSLCTTSFVTFREILLPDSVIMKYFVDISGCTGIILLIGYIVGWLEASWFYVLLVFAEVLVVYLFVQFIIWLQSKHDEEDLNRLLSKQFEEKKKQ